MTIFFYFCAYCIVYCSRIKMRQRKNVIFLHTLYIVYPQRTNLCILRKIEVSIYHDVSNRCFYCQAIKKSQKSLASLTQLFWDRLLDKEHFFVVDKVNGIWGHKLKSCIFYDIRQICYVRSPLCIYPLGQFCRVSKCGVSSKRNKTRPTETIRPISKLNKEEMICRVLLFGV